MHGRLLCLLRLLLVVTLTQAQQNVSDEVRITSSGYRILPIFRTEANEVPVEVIVRNRRGEPVAGLQSEQFEVYDSGRPVQIRRFSVQRGARAIHEASRASENKLRQHAESVSDGVTVAQNRGVRYVELFFDDLATQQKDFIAAKLAAERFLSRLAPEDFVGVYAASAGQISPLSQARDAVLRDIVALEARSRSSMAGGSCPRITPYQAMRIVHTDPSAMQAALADYCACSGRMGCDRQSGAPGAVGADIFSPRNQGNVEDLNIVIATAQATWQQTKQVSQDVLASIRGAVMELASRPGKRILVLVSAGFLSDDLEGQMDRITSEALREQVSISSVDAKGLYAEAPGRPLNEPQQGMEMPLSTFFYETHSLGERLEAEDGAMARFAESTGGLMFHNNNDLDLGFRQVGLSPDVAYLLAIKPAEDGKYHRLQIKIKDKAYGEFIQVRPGYLAPSKSEVNLEASTEELQNAVVAGDARNGIPMAVKVELSKATEHRQRLTVGMRFDISKLSLQRRGGRQTGTLIFVAALFDSTGQFITGKRADMDLELKPETYDRLSKSGINGVLAIEVQPGAYRLRAVVREAAQGKIAAETRNLRIE
ncbi:MAG: VWA domain-containing protein [Acidobacteria bacterium]|nr:VWA domain-containing protein [Acidobacteriota bacterium]